MARIAASAMQQQQSRRARSTHFQNRKYEPEEPFFSKPELSAEFEKSLSLDAEDEDPASDSNEASEVPELEAEESHGVIDVVVRVTVHVTSSV